MWETYTNPMGQHTNFTPVTFPFLCDSKIQKTDFAGISHKNVRLTL